MLYGCGIDLIEVDRVKKLLNSGGNVLSRLFNVSELIIIGSPPYNYGKYKQISRFYSMKEAVLKAFGVGWQEGVSWHDIELSSSSCHEANIGGVLKSISDKNNIIKVLAVSWADKRYAFGQAFVFSC